MAEHRRLLVAVVAAPVLFALLGGLYCGWIGQLGDTRHRSHFRMLPAERLEYAASSWLGDTGTVAVEVSPMLEHEDGSASYRIIYTVETSEVVSAAYVMKGQIRVLLDAKTLLPLEYEEKMRTGLGVTGGREKHKMLVYDRATGDLHYYKLRKDEKDKGLQFRRSRKIPPGTHHFASLIYFLRYMPIESGQELSVVISDRKRDIPITASVLREEDYKAPGGETRKAIVLKTVADFGKDEIKGTTFLVWLDKAEHFPVRLDAKVRWGTISLTLVGRTIRKDTSSEVNESRGNHTSTLPVDAPSRKAPA